LHRLKYPTVRIGTWNTEWAKPGSKRGLRVREALAAPDCDILGVTEGYAGILPPGGHLIEADADYGYAQQDGRRKVLLWSKQPWSEVDAIGSPEQPGGRFAAGVTATPIGSLNVVGVCIPWRDAHVRTGRKDREPWEDHIAWLTGFEALPYRRPASPTVVLGDFNQRLPRKYQPASVHEELLRVFEPFELATTGDLTGAPGLAIDHIAHSKDLRASQMGIWQKRSELDQRLSDHFGIWCSLQYSTAAARRAAGFHAMLCYDIALDATSQERPRIADFLALATTRSSGLHHRVPRDPEALGGLAGPHDLVGDLERVMDRGRDDPLLDTDTVDDIFGYSIKRGSVHLARHPGASLQRIRTGDAHLALQNEVVLTVHCASL